MRSEKDVEAYLLRLNRRFTSVDDQTPVNAKANANDQPGTFVIQTNHGMPPIALRVDPPVVVIRVRIGDVSDKGNVELFRKLLELNAKALLYSSYGLEEDSIVLASALELENLDFNEIAATLDEIDVALTQQVPILAGLNKSSSDSASQAPPGSTNTKKSG